MKTKYIKTSVLPMLALLVITAAKAQTSVREKSDMDADRHSSYVAYTTRNGQQVQKVQTNWHNHLYYIELVSGKMTSLSVDGEKIPASDWGKYDGVVADIKAQIKRDEVQAKRDRAQAKLDQEQASKDQEQARRDQAQAKLDRDQAGRDQIDAQKDQEEAVRDREQAKKDQEQAQRDQAQAKLDQEQAVRDQIQAKKDQEQAAEDERLLKAMMADLVSDKIVPDEKSIHEITLNADGMTVNGVKQPDSVYQKYKSKYDRFESGNFSYGNEQNSYRGIHMSRQE